MFARTAVVARTRWPSRSVAVGATVLLHLLLAAPMVLGVSEQKKRSPDGDGTIASASRGEQYETMILLDLSAISASAAESLPLIDSDGLIPEYELQLVSSTPQPPELKREDFEEAESEREEAGDPAGNAALFGQYMGQVTARIERAWMRPRSGIEGGRFECRVRITQDNRGHVYSIELQSCGGDESWRRSLTMAILRASPLSAPPEPWLFTPTLTLNFSGRQYVAGQTPDYDYEPANHRVAMGPGPLRPLLEPGTPHPQPAVLDGEGDVELTIVGSDVRWTRKESAAQQR